jgi:hypothetical protein
LPAWTTVSILIFSISWSVKLAVAAVLAMTFVSPSAGLLAVATYTPFGTRGEFVAGLGWFQAADAAVLAFLAALVLRRVADRPGPRAPARTGWLLAIAVVVSVYLGVRQSMRPPVIEPVDVAGLSETLRVLRAGLAAAAGMLEGIALVAATIVAFRWRPALAVQLPVALAAPATAIAFMRVLPRADVSSSSPADPYLTMVLCLTIGMAVRGRRRSRFAWIAVAALLSVALLVNAMRFTAVRSGATITSEVGIASALMLLWLAAVLAPAVRALVRTPRDARLLGATTGAVLFFALAIVGELLPAATVVHAFWIQLGLASALGQSNLLNVTGTSARAG